MSNLSDLPPFLHLAPPLLSPRLPLLLLSYVLTHSRLHLAPLLSPRLPLLLRSYVPSICNHLSSMDSQGVPPPPYQQNTPVIPQLNVQDPPHLVLGQPETLPPIPVGTDLLPAGPHFKTPLLETISQKTFRWEPLLRLQYAVALRAVSFHAQIGASVARVEATTIQIVGTPETSLCTVCLSNKGPFSHCTRDPATRRCGNCHWLGRSCSLDPDPNATSSTRRRMHRVSREDLASAADELESLLKQRGSLRTCLRGIVSKLHEDQGAVRRAIQSNAATHQAIAAQSFAQAHQVLGIQATDIECLGNKIEELRREQESIINLLTETDPR
ncbi:Protein of unknown function DUF3716 [Penicillium canariense]|uniref:Uncharacterized protein n=1 Tax=Penicillium canariense TaxID=189055 RepID=A0A9W9IJQ6_9EURO|nr:Protein of unknown function DUF3716 [Penicillium canariense]KAJ5176980.1 Protein of unknown function DUF3716 [Penicillium canariense]